MRKSREEMLRPGACHSGSGGTGWAVQKGTRRKVQCIAHEEMPARAGNPPQRHDLMPPPKQLGKDLYWIYLSL